MPDLLTRRAFLHGSAVAALTATHGMGAQAATADPLPAAPADADDEAYWRKVAAHYEVSPDFTNLENAYYGIMSKPVAEDFKRNIDILNRDNSRLLRREFDRDGIEAIRVQLARHLGAPVDEIAITRGATESLQNLISNYKLLKPGDTILHADLDYDAMIYAINDLAERRGARIGVIRIPEPATRQSVLDTYEQALRDNPRARLLLLTHITHRTGLVFPVDEITRMARQRGVDVILDVAQSWGQLNYRMSDLQADFIGGNLHKWIGAPLGLGFIYIRKTRLADIGVHMGDRDFAADDIRSRVHSGTLNAASIMTIPKALQMHAQIGAAAKGARLRHLRDHWVRQARGIDKVEILTPDTPGMYGAVTSFRIKGLTTPEQNSALANRLMDQFKIFTVVRHGPVGGSCIRVTPALFTTKPQLDQLVAALRQIAAT
ncbi:aminotransferase class V-fold PLP-dependent enzyme [Duganella aceris]|uniref:Aminotransferase class V-fold PLP-dependent enzyme n=1 Tax=Duganella aceris TaxID=2703883 RepID=A0ABX0FP63_9BURK|nr:aminotransferase class V-fold PLP-dependent enzyme [Duganella aceris]NGZ86272.1 aminotransferase class V-fold PLP-dependent enzyme [Duganella aceris]